MSFWYCVVCLFALFHLLMIYFLYRFSYNKIFNEPPHLTKILTAKYFWRGKFFCSLIWKNDTWRETAITREKRRKNSAMTRRNKYDAGPALKYRVSKHFFSIFLLQTFFDTTSIKVVTNIKSKKRTFLNKYVLELYRTTYK